MANRDDLISRFEDAEEIKKPSGQPEEENIDAEEAAELIASEKAEEEKGVSKPSSSKKKRKKKSFFKSFKSVISNKTFNKMLNLFLVCLVINAVEYFAIINYFKIPTKGALGKVVGIVAIAYFMYKSRLKPSNVGLAPSGRVIFRSLKNALLFNLPIIPVYLLEVLYYMSEGKHVTVTIFAYTANYSKFGWFYWLCNILLLIGVTALSALMLEMLFRGIFIRMAKDEFGFNQTAFIISVFYAIWYLIIPLSKVTSGQSPRKLVSLCIFYLLFEFAMSYKWCLCSKATGSLWLSIFDHFIFNTILGIVRVVDMSTPTLDNVDVYRYYRLALIQAISIVICVIYYRNRMRRKEEMLENAGIRGHHAFDSMADRSQEEVEHQAEKIKSSSAVDMDYSYYLEKINRKKH